MEVLCAQLPMTSELPQMQALCRGREATLLSHGTQWDHWLHRGYTELQTACVRLGISAAQMESIVAKWEAHFALLPFPRVLVLDQPVNCCRLRSALLMERPGQGFWHYRITAEGVLKGHPFQFYGESVPGWQNTVTALSQTSALPMDAPISELVLPADHLNWVTLLGDITMENAKHSALCAYVSALWRKVIYSEYRSRFYGIVSRFLGSELPDLLAHLQR